MADDDTTELADENEVNGEVAGHDAALRRIRRLHRAEGFSIEGIARRVGVASNTVHDALRSEGPPCSDRPRWPWVVDAFEGQITGLLATSPRMPATMITERIGWQRGLTQLQVRVRELRPLFVPPDPMQRTEYVPGELAQWDLWFPPVDVPFGFDQQGRPPVIFVSPVEVDT